MISERLVDTIENEGRKNNFHIHFAGGEYDESGDFMFVIKLKRSGLDYLNKKRIPNRYLPKFLQKAT